MLHNLLDSDEPPAAFVEARKVLFTHRSGTNTDIALNSLDTRLVSHTEPDGVVTETHRYVNN